jgi:hypothetical protein
MSVVILPKSVDVSKIRYTEVRTLPSGAKSMYINYGTGKLRIQTPIMSLPYGLGEGYDEKQAAKAGKEIVKPLSERKYDLTLSFRGMDENPKIEIFLNKLKEIEQKIIDDAFDNRLEWFKDDYDGNKNFVAKLFNPIIKIDKDSKTGKIVGKYPPTLKVKIPFDGKNGRFTFDSYDLENNEIQFEDIMYKLKSGKSQLIIELSGMWFAGGKYGCTWKVISGKFQIYQNHKVTFLEDSDTEKAIAEVDEEEDDDDDIHTPLQRTESARVVKNSDDEEEEDGDGEESSTPPVVEKVEKKRGGGRTKK